MSEAAAAPPDSAPVGAAFAGADTIVLPLVFGLLNPRSLVAAKAVCTAWQEVASDPQVRRAAFVNNWQLLGCRAAPRQQQFYETAALTSFVLEHEVAGGDTLQMLAVRHGVSVPCLKRLNNLMSDHALHSRRQLFIPVASQEQLVGRLVRFHFCATIKRDFAVLLPAARRASLDAREQLRADVLERQHHGAAHEPAPRPAARAGRAKVDALQAKLCHMLGRSLYIDVHTAQFYLEDAGGDVKAAMHAFAQDVAWEGTTAGPLRTVPVQKWIEGEHLHVGSRV